jgi:gamma-carbonic anhydrase
MPLGDHKPVLGNGAWVAPTASVVGNVTLADAASVWFGTVMRGDVAPVVIGARTNVQVGRALATCSYCI